VPFASVNNTRLFYRLEGTKGRPMVILSHSLGCDLGMWEPQMPDFLEHFEVLRYDTRGHGASNVPSGDTSIDQLGSDVIALADALGIPKFSFCGLSMGGAIGLWLAAHRPERLTAVVLANTSPRFDGAALETRRQTVLTSGIAAVAEAALGRFFSPETLAESVHAHSVRRVLLMTDPAGYAACCAGLRDFDIRRSLHTIKTPSLVIGGNRDASTPWEAHGAVLAKEIAGAQSLRLESAHLSNIEFPRAFTVAVLEFVLRHTTAAAPQDSGARVRREVLGDEHVDRASDAADDFNRDFQALITNYAWGAVWARPGLDRRTRRLLVLAVTAAMGRWEEFRMHLRAALEHRMEVSDFKEVFLQVGIYAGVPAANTAFSIAREEIQRQEEARKS
jgi:3-oxoadipate enol-lactonase / 4-carboxymuconolactone decarboxylase